MTATGVGCLFFLDTEDDAKGAGLTALSILLVLINVLYVGLMFVLVSVHGARHAKLHARKAKKNWLGLLCWLKLTVQCSSSKSVAATNQIDVCSTARRAQVSSYKFQRMLSRGLSNLSVDTATSGSESQ